MRLRSSRKCLCRQFRLRQHPAEQIVEVMGDSAGERTETLQLLSPKGLRLRPPGIRNIHAGSDVPDELAVPVARYASVQDPAIFAVGTPQPELYLERTARLKRISACTEAMVEII